MRGPALRLISSGLLAAAIGAIFAAHWIACLGVESDSGSIVRTVLVENASAGAVILVGALALSVVLFWRCWRIDVSRILTVGVSLLIACVFYMLLGYISHLYAAARIHPVAPAAAFAGLLLLASRIFKFRHSTAWSLVLGVGLLPVFHHLDLISGVTLASTAAQYPAPPDAKYYLQISLSCTLLAALTVLVQSMFQPSSAVNKIKATASGALFGASAAAMHLIILLISLASGLSPDIIFSYCLLIFAAVGFVVAAEPIPQIKPRFGRACSATLLGILAFYIILATRGYNDYASLARIYPDLTSAYIHFFADGTYSRTLDNTASSTRAWRAAKFISRYPYSAYRPAAMLAAAEAEIQLWRFGEAAELLRKLNLEYPHLDGYANVLLALCDFAAGNPTTILRPAPASSNFHRWRQTRGAQLAASAAERAGLINRARGYHSAYLDYLLEQRQTSWLPASLQMTASRIDSLNSPSPAAQRRTDVLLRVLAAGKPVRGARVIIVDPRYDPALPADSVQFTGAWSVPAWNGFWALTDGNGVARISNVPYGRYEVVLGLDIEQGLRGFVVSRNVPLITVDKQSVDAGTIYLVPAVELLSPSFGAVVKNPVRLQWKAYPNAAYYSVSILTVHPAQSIDSTPSGRPTGATCWAKSQITGTSVDVPVKPLLSAAAGSARPSFMWIVYAHGADGQLLSSSEHYFEPTESIFHLVR